MKTVSVLSRKGGAGKTTVSVNLGLAAMQQGLRVVVADVDPLRSAAEVLRDRKEAASLLIETSAKKLALLQETCVANRCDLLIIDTPTQPQEDVALAVRAADVCLAVARPTRLDVAAVTQTLELLSRQRARALVVLNQCPPKRGETESDLVLHALELLAQAGLPVAATRLRSRVAYQRAFAQSQSVTEWDTASASAADIQSLLSEVQAQLNSPEIFNERIAKLRLPNDPKAMAGGQLVNDLLRRMTRMAS
jgi:chromosome partitioning protein